MEDADIKMYKQILLDIAYLEYIEFRGGSADIVPFISYKVVKKFEGERYDEIMDGYAKLENLKWITIDSKEFDFEHPLMYSKLFVSITDEGRVHLFESQKFMKSFKSNNETHLTMIDKQDNSRKVELKDSDGNQINLGDQSDFLDNRPKIKQATHRQKTTRKVWIISAVSLVILALTAYFTCLLIATDRLPSWLHFCK